MFKMKVSRSFWFLHKMSYKQFGKKSIIYKPLFITGKKYISIGKNVTIRNNARIECISKWNQKQYDPLITIGDNTIFEQDSHIISNAKLEIGANCLFSARVFITTCEHNYNKIGVPIIQQDLSDQSVSIGNNCFIGMDAKIFPGVKIGENVIIGSNAIVMEDIPSFSVAIGAPAKVIKKYDFNEKKWKKI